MLVGVEADGPAERSGLLIGDVLIAVNGQPVNTADDLVAQLSSARAGQQVSARLVRGGEVHVHQGRPKPTITPTHAATAGSRSRRSGAGFTE